MITLPPMLHVGLVVADFDATVADFHNRWGAETVRVTDMDFPSAVYRGDPAPSKARYGFISSGASEIEIIQPIDGDSPYTDFLRDNGGDGVHHLAYIVDSIEDQLAQLKAAGHHGEPIYAAPAPGDGRFVYVEDAAHGPVIELVELSAAYRKARGI